MNKENLDRFVSENTPLSKIPENQTELKAVGHELEDALEDHVEQFREDPLEHAFEVRQDLHDAQQALVDLGREVAADDIQVNTSLDVAQTWVDLDQLFINASRRLAERLGLIEPQPECPEEQTPRS